MKNKILDVPESYVNCLFLLTFVVLVTNRKGTFSRLRILTASMEPLITWSSMWIVPLRSINNPKGFLRDAMSYLWSWNFWTCPSLSDSSVFVCFDHCFAFENASCAVLPDVLCRHSPYNQISLFLTLYHYPYYRNYWTQINDSVLSFQEYKNLMQ